jgi:hypothetical protein
MFREIKTYAFINAKLRARLSKLLDDDFFSALVRTHSLIDALELLKTTAYQNLEQIYSRTGDLKMAELQLFREEIRILSDVLRHVEGSVRDFCGALLTYYEIENLKRVMRLWFDRVVRGRAVEDFFGYLYRWGRRTTRASWRPSPARRTASCFPKHCRRSRPKTRSSPSRSHLTNTITASFWRR